MTTIEKIDTLIEKSEELLNVLLNTILEDEIAESIGLDVQIETLSNRINEMKWQRRSLQEKE